MATTPVRRTPTARSLVPWSIVLAVVAVLGVRVFIRANPIERQVERRSNVGHPVPGPRHRKSSNPAPPRISAPVSMAVGSPVVPATPPVGALPVPTPAPVPPLPDVVRSGPIAIPPGLGVSRRERHLRMTLFPGIGLSGVVIRPTIPYGGSVVWLGWIRNQPNSSVGFAVTKRKVTGHIETGDGRRFRITPTDDGGQRVEELDSSAAPFEGQDTVRSDQARPLDEASGDGVLDLLVVFTPAFELAAGGVGGVASATALAVAETNTAFAQSGIKTELRLVAIERVAYQEVGNTDRDLDRLVNDHDGYLDDVHVLRNTYGADLVSVFTTHAEDACGRAQLGPGSVRDGFSVLTWPCLADGEPLAHEVGHGLGMDHDAANVKPGVGAAPFARGYRFTGRSGVQWRTIMAYAPGRPTMHFSNPEILFDGVPTGMAVSSSTPANNALVGNTNARAVSSRRARVIAREGGCTYRVRRRRLMVRADGGHRQVRVDTAPQCAWSLIDDVEWAATDGHVTHLGSGLIAIDVAPNRTTQARTGEIVVAGHQLLLRQEGLPL